MFPQLLGFWFGFVSASACRSPEGIWSSLRRDRVKAAADWGLWLTQAGGWGGRGTKCGVSLWRQRPARCCYSPNSAVCSPRKLSLDHGTLAVAGCTGSREGGVDSDLCLHTGFLVAAAAALAFHACLLCPRYSCCSRPSLQLMQWCSESLLLMHPETTVSCLLGRSRLFPGLPSS